MSRDYHRANVIKQKKSVGQFKKSGNNLLSYGFRWKPVKNPIKYGCGLASNEIRYISQSRALESLQRILKQLFDDDNRSLAAATTSTQSTAIIWRICITKYKEYNVRAERNSIWIKQKKNGRTFPNFFPLHSSTGVVWVHGYSTIHIIFYVCIVHLSAIFIFSLCN